MSLIPLPRAEGRHSGLRGRGRGEPYVARKGAWEEEEGKGESGWAPEEREGRREERGGALLKFKGISGVTVSSSCNDQGNDIS